MVPLRLSILAILTSVIFTFVFPQKLSIDIILPVRIFGIIMLFLCDLAMFWAFHTLGNMWTVYVCRLEDHKLVKSGPYRCARHPMYTFSWLFCLCFILATGKWLIFSFLSLNALVATIRFREEERLLLTEFGDEYAEYMKTTGAFCCVPGVCDCGIDVDEEREHLLAPSKEETSSMDTIED